MYRQFNQPGFQPLPGDSWNSPFSGPIPKPMPPVQQMTFEEMYMILGNMYEMIKCMYEMETE